MIKTVFFDLGNVLIFFDLERMFSQIAHCSGLQAAEVKRLIYQTELREMYEKGKISTEELYKEVQKHAKKIFSQDAFVTAFSDIFTPNVDLWPTVSHLKEQGIRLVLLSNTSEGHFRYLSAKYPILQLFDHCILSYEVGVWKPDPQIFQKALQHANCSPQECFYTDDIAEFIDAAQKEGLPGAIYTTVSELQEHLAKRGLAIQHPNH